METTDHTEWKTLFGREILWSSVRCCGMWIFFFSLVELFNERLGESDYVMMDCSLDFFFFLLNISGW